MRDPVSHGAIETHALYGAATPNVGSAWALPRAHPLWAPMDFECKELTKETASEREERLARFEPPAEPRRQLTSEEIAEVRTKCRAHFASKKNTEEGRVDFMESDKFAGKKPGYYFGRSAKGIGYHIDYAQMRRLMTLSPGDRCEARYEKVRRYFDGVVCAAHARAGVLLDASTACGGYAPSPRSVASTPPRRESESARSVLFHDAPTARRGMPPRRESESE